MSFPRFRVGEGTAYTLWTDVDRTGSDEVERSSAVYFSEKVVHKTSLSSLTGFRPDFKATQNNELCFPFKLNNAL